MLCLQEKMFNVSQQRKKYTPKYRREAVNPVLESNRPIVHEDRDIVVARGLLGKWCRFRVVGVVSPRSWYRCSVYPLRQEASLIVDAGSVVVLCCLCLCQLPLGRNRLETCPRDATLSRYRIASQCYGGFLRGAPGIVIYQEALQSVTGRLQTMLLSSGLQYNTAATEST